MSLKDLGEYRLKGMQWLEHLYQVVAPGLETGFAPLDAESRPKHNLPLELTSFIGREQEIEAVTALLAEQRLVTLTGVGGTGKTRLALRTAEAALEDYPDGAWFVELAPLADPELVPRARSAALGLQESAQQRPLEQLKAFLRHKQLLVVLDNLRAALTWALERDAAKGLRLMTASFWFWWCRGYTLEGEGWLSQLYDRVKELAVEVDPALLAEARARQAMLLSMTHRGDQLAYHVAEEALQLAEALGDDHKRIRAMAWLALCWNALSYKLVNTFGRQCLAIAEEIGDRFLISEAVDMLYQTEPDLAKAKALLDRRLRLEREIGDEDGLVSSYLGLGGYYFNTGDFTQAFQMLDKQIQIAQKLGNRGFAVLGFYYQGYLFLDLGEVDKAIEALEQSLEEALVLGLPLIFLPYIFLGYAYGLKRDWSEAERDLQRVIVIARENHNDFWENYAVFSLAEVAWSLGKVETAKEYYQEAAELSQGYRTIGLGNYAAGMLAFLNESPAAAEGFFLAALKDCAAAGLFPGIAECLEALALCTIQEERFEKAVHLHGVAVSLRDWRRYIYYYGGSTLIWGTVKAALEPVQAALGESRYAQLLQEGQAVSGNFIYRRMVVHPDVVVRIFVDEGQQRHTILRPDWAAVCNPVFPVLDGQYYPEYHLWGMTIMPSWGYAKGVIDTHYY